MPKESIWMTPGNERLLAGLNPAVVEVAEHVGSLLPFDGKGELPDLTRIANTINVERGERDVEISDPNHDFRAALIARLVAIAQLNQSIKTEPIK